MIDNYCENFSKAPSTGRETPWIVRKNDFLVVNPQKHFNWTGLNIRGPSKNTLNTPLALEHFEKTMNSDDFLEYSPRLDDSSMTSTAEFARSNIFNQKPSLLDGAWMLEVVFLC